MPDEEIPLLSTEEAVAEVRRWLETGGVDPHQIFTAFGETVIRYEDLIPLLQGGSPDAELLRFAISRGRAMRPSRPRPDLLQIRARPPAGQEND
ncbi:MAG: hypothetical protein ACE147_10720 [Candidatus Methylomirabilales bacterium]